jgi:hypothetical protein
MLLRPITTKYSKDMNMKNLLLTLSIASFLLPLSSDAHLISLEKFTYKFKKLVGRGTMSYIVKNSSDNVTVESHTKIYSFGNLKKEIRHISKNNANLSPMQNALCQWPTARNAKFNCSALKINENGLFYYKAYNASSPTLDLFNVAANNVLALDIRKTFSEFKPHIDQIHDISSLFLFPRLVNLNLDYNGKSLYMAMNQTVAKITIYVKKEKRDTLKISFSVDNRSAESIKKQIPEYAIYNTAKKVITKLQLETSFGKVEVKLDEGASQYQN